MPPSRLFLEFEMHRVILGLPKGRWTQADFAPWYSKLSLSGHGAERLVLLEQALVEQGYSSGSTPRKNHFPIYLQVAPTWATVFQSHVLYKPSQDSVHLSRRQKCNFSSRKVIYTPRRCTEIYPLTCMCYLPAIFTDSGIT